MSTRKESLEATKPTIPHRREQVLDALCMQPPMSRSQIAAATGMRLSSVCGRVRELLDEGKVVVDGECWDDITARNVETIRLA